MGRAGWVALWLFAAACGGRGADGAQDQGGEETSGDADAAEGIVLTQDGETTWPPQGPGCDRLVRCCETRGYVVDGTAMGTGGLICLLGSAADGACNDALATIDENTGQPCE